MRTGVEDSLAGGDVMVSDSKHVTTSADAESVLHNQPIYNNNDEVDKHDNSNSEKCQGIKRQFATPPAGQGGTWGRSR